MEKTGTPENFGAYISKFPKDAQQRLLEMRECLRKAAPGAEEGIKWGVPAFSYQRILFTFAAFKHHIGLYPTPSAINALAKDLKKYKTTSSTIQFPLDKPLPANLIRKVAAYRVREVVEKDAKWM